MQNTGKRFLPGAQVTPNSCCTIKPHSIMDDDHTRVASWSLCSQASTSCVLWYLPRSRVGEEGQTAGVNSPAAICLTSCVVRLPVQGNLYFKMMTMESGHLHSVLHPGHSLLSSKSSVASLVTSVEPVFPVSQEVSVTFYPFLLSYSKSP